MSAFATPNYIKLIDFGIKGLLVLCGVITALWGCSKNKENKWEIKEPKAPFLFMGTTTLAFSLFLLDFHSYLLRSFPSLNEIYFDTIFCLGFALYFWILGTAFRNWTDIFLKPTTHLLLSATSLRNFSAFLKEQVEKAISEKEDLLPSEALRRIRNFMLKLLVLQALGIALSLFRNPTPPIAEEWVGAIALIAFLLGGGIGFFSLVIAISMFLRKLGLSTNIQKGTR